MNWLTNKSTRTKLFMSFGVMLGFLLVVIAVAYSGVSSIQASQQNLYEDDFADVSDLQEMLANQGEVRGAILNMMLTGNRAEQDALHQLVGQIAKRNSEMMAKLIERNRDDPKALAQLQQLSALRGQFGKIRDQEIIPLIYQGKIEQARQLTIKDQGGFS